MAHLATVINRKAIQYSSTLGLPRLVCHWRPNSLSHIPVRAYSRKTKTRLSIETSQLEREIQQLERAIVDQERKVAAQKAYEESILKAKERSESAKLVYQNVTSPLTASTSSPTKRIPGNVYTQPYLLDRILEDLKLVFIDSQGSNEETIKRFQDILPSAEDTHAAALPSSTIEKPSEDINKGPASDSLATMVKDANPLAAERIQKLTIEHWNTLIYVNALEGNYKNAEKVVQLMDEVGVQPDMTSFNHLMQAYAKSDQLKKAHNTIELMLKNGLTPSTSAYSSLMEIHARRRDVASAFKVFEALKQHHNPDVDVFTNLIKGCLRAGEYDLGWKVFEQMQRSGATPDESTYNLMIHACAKTDQVEKALDIFKTYPSRGLHPTEATFSSLIYACAMRPQYFATAFALLNEMQTIYGFEPDIMTYNTLLFACSKRQELLTARRIFQKIVQLDSEGTLKLDPITVTNFLWCVTYWKTKDQHIRNMKQRSRYPAQAQIESSSSLGAKTTELKETLSSIAEPPKAGTTELSIIPSYFMLPERPPKDEHEALAEGELVFSWFISRCAEQFPASGTSELQPSKGLESEQIEDSQIEDVAIIDNEESLSLSLPHLAYRSPIRTRLLNAYLAMYVRHLDMEKSTEIYRGYFSHFHQKRDSWSYAIMLEGCYDWKNVELATEVFRDWRSWRKSTGKLTEKSTRRPDYQCYNRMINLLARMNYLDESIALLEELSIAATPPNTRLRSEIECTATARPSNTSAFDILSSSSASPASASTYASQESSSSTSVILSHNNEIPSSLSFLDPIHQESVLPIYPQLKDFPIVYTKTWELENEGARKLLLRLCHGKIDSRSGVTPSLSVNDANSGQSQDIHSNSNNDDSILLKYLDKRPTRHQKALRNTAIKWKGEHPQEKGFQIGYRRIRELDQNPSKRGQDRR
ncbi:hypothetical protein BX616_002106 [Lobosporangium transversale]|uniref:Pentacotripeptide-repeat region of PRORP domain-containing protein n=1 Tax=Lobosporangium transversale TaxID=64571 RepID=A0A1Y2GCM3_9FUNG|nr:hypothetical protein BCR41DRAFT_425561 [Lobosporangium transversale]KAF9901874.1 hypothetical protein BX616_002106 [Lobosporangium transversale]ORZ05330.1 hypothetical protein BCR41DRAFT_425561 [Lobosporangium transversale]|eukprot:XP_021877022.1 hypothetical protein BCR41DRAFT_425561 [Lobosporangium transversale]